MQYNDLEQAVEDIVKAYNSTYHQGILCTPNEARNKEGCSKVIGRNSRYGGYATKFKKGYRERFDIDDRVRITKHDNLKGPGRKDKRGRFLDQGIVIAKYHGDSYLVKTDGGKYVKKRHYDIKKKMSVDDVEVKEMDGKGDDTTRLERGML